MKINSLQGVTLRLVSGGKESSGDASSPFGPLRVGLIQRRVTHEVQLEELLNSLESRVAMLESKFLGVLNTFLKDTEHLAKPFPSTSDTGGTDGH